MLIELGCLVCRRLLFKLLLVHVCVCVYIYIYIYCNALDAAYTYTSHPLHSDKTDKETKIN